ncbi:serine/threonine-protein kinase 33 [Biomphalaria glabrata]|nr:serine/threonine-protein kinase 33 [Biomphalaria glabrata]
MSVVSSDRVDVSISNISTSSVGSNNGVINTCSTSSQRIKIHRRNSSDRNVIHTRMEDEDVHIEYIYNEEDIIGEGSFGKVYKAQQKGTNETVAIKEIVKEKAGSSGLRQLEKEVTIFKKVDHKNIIHLREVIESSKKMYLIMELCKGGDLANVLKHEGAFKEGDAKVVMSSLAEAIKYLHQQGIMHRDLKLENILIAEEFTDRKDIKVKVSDFGLSTQQTYNSFENMQEQYCGTPSYMAPEMNSTYSYPVDVWAMGIIMYYMLTQYPKDNELNESISKNGPIFAEPQWKEVSKQAKDLLQSMLNRDPAHRLSSGEVLNHEWFTGKKKEHGNVLELMKEYRRQEKENEVSSSSDGEVPSAIIESEPVKKVGSIKQVKQKVDGSPKLHPLIKGTKASTEGLHKPKATASSSTKKIPAKTVPTKKTETSSKKEFTSKTKKH